MGGRKDEEESGGGGEVLLATVSPFYWDEKGSLIKIISLHTTPERSCGKSLNKFLSFLSLFEQKNWLMTTKRTIVYNLVLS